MAYYGIPILKKPFWKWEIALYFFAEGVSAGAYILCSLAEAVNRESFEDAVVTGRYLAFFTLLVCPPLLIADLGRPERFHHMLRITKRTSPMNHGAWALSGYGVCAALSLALESSVQRFRPLAWFFRALQKFVSRRLVYVAGFPFALTMVSYPGVLLSTTSIPVWAHTHFLGPLFAASSLSTGAAALLLVNYRSKHHGLHRALTKVEDVAMVAEAAATACYLKSAGRAARPLTRGKQSKLFLLGAVAAGLVLPGLLRRSKSHFLRSGVAPILTLAGAIALKWAVTYAGQESILDVDLAIHNAPSQPGEHSGNRTCNTEA